MFWRAHTHIPSSHILILPSIHTHTHTHTDIHTRTSNSTPPLWLFLGEKGSILHKWSESVGQDSYKSVGPQKKAAVNCPEATIAPE